MGIEHLLRRTMNNKTQFLYFFSFLALVGFVGWDIQNWENSKTHEVQASEPISPSIYSEVDDSSFVDIEEEMGFEDYVTYKFGNDAWKAFLLLKGNEDCGGENGSHNPNAVYVNTDGSRDRGYWQINDYYHPHVSDWCASDIKCSTDYAYRMYVNDDNTFVRWTVGRCLNI